MKYKLYLIICLFAFAGCQQASYTYTAKPNTTAVSEVIEEDVAIKNLVEPYKQKLDSQMNEVIGLLELDMPRSFNGKESLLGNFCTELIFQQASKQSAPDLAVLTIGGLRVPLSAGDVNVGLVYELMPFDNDLVVITVPGTVVKQVIERIITKENTSLANVTATFRRGELVSAKIGGEEFDVNKSYKIATSDYLAGGGDYMEYLKSATETEYIKVKVRDAIIAHFRELTAKGMKGTATIGKNYTIEE